ncbi:MAG: 50S ribosomal protein L25 [Chloroflexi bacterium]|uniref:50S ribosomal protein L25 n=1 Tax=Candidatus Flexifilum breve TaxID=3140694 RepID=UPI003135233C|nr:50S ribosomal protein L25 [Chloroflexota bacterium]MBK9750549.1 50S ribosomal protein L25 [Chloroflexota bacterium]
MADNYTIDAQARSITGKKVSQLRNQGLVPAVVYGEAVQPVHVQIPYRALEVALMKAGGTHLITLSVEGQAHTVITRDVQRDILKGKITHVDFLAVSATTKLKTEVPVHFTGEAPAVALRVGVLNTVTPYVEVEALPADLIDHIDVDLSSLKMVGDAIHVRDLKLGDKVVAVTDEDTVIVAVGIIGAGAAEEPVEGEVTSAEPEVIQKGKIEEDEE